MQNSGEYRVLDRRKFAAFMAVLLAVLAVAVWLGLDELADYANRLEELAAAEPERAGDILNEKLRLLAVLNGIILSALALLIIWHGMRGWRSGSMPPKGAWILEGQRTWSGPPAVRIAQFTITAGVLLGVLAVFSSVVLWRLGDTLKDPGSQGAGAPVAFSDISSADFMYSAVLAIYMRARRPLCLAVQSGNTCPTSTGSAIRCTGSMPAASTICSRRVR